MRCGLIVCVLIGCGNDPTPATSDANSHLSADANADARADAHADANADAQLSPDAPPTTPDAAPMTPDAAFPTAQHVHILIDNFCNTSADPPSFNVPRGSNLQLTWHNHSVDYDADVWLSYGGGYLGLPTGATWADPFTFCASAQRPYDAAGDVSIAGGPTSACPRFRVLIHCL